MKIKSKKVVKRKHKKEIRNRDKHRRYKEAPRTEIVRMYNDEYSGLIIRVHFEQDNGNVIPYDYRITPNVVKSAISRKNITPIANYIAKQAAQSHSNLIVLRLVLRDRLVEEFATHRIDTGKSSGKRNEEVESFKSKMHLDATNILRNYRFTVYHQKKK